MTKGQAIYGDLAAVIYNLDWSTMIAREVASTRVRLASVAYTLRKTFNYGVRVLHVSRVSFLFCVIL